jgi:hypothetical protein
MRAGKRGSRPASRRRTEALPVQALYCVGQLARALGASHRQVQKLLEIEKVRVLRVGRYLLVPLSELEEKSPTLWASITGAESLRTALGDT